MTVTRLCLSHPRVGCGWRVFVITKRGRKWASLFYPPTLTGFKLPVRTLERLERDALPVTGSVPNLRRTIRATMKQYERLGLSDGGNAAKEALAVLKTSGETRVA